MAKPAGVLADVMFPLKNGIWSGPRRQFASPGKGLISFMSYKMLVLPVRIELTTSALPRMRSTTELRQHIRQRRTGRPQEERA